MHGLALLELRWVLITSHMLFCLFFTSHWGNCYCLIYRWGTWDTECWRTVPELTKLWPVDPGCKLTQPKLSPELEPLPCAISCYGTGEHGFKAGGKGLHAIILSGQLIFGSAMSPLCSLSCSHLPKPTHQHTTGSCRVTELHARASPGCRGSAQPQWLPVAHFHGNCSFHCNLHPNPRGTHESSKWGWNETRSPPPSLLFLPLPHR